MNTHILLVEGTRVTGKSTLINALLRKYVQEQDVPGTLLNLSQTHTHPPILSGPSPEGGSSGGTGAMPPIGKREHRELLRKILRMLDWTGYGATPQKQLPLTGLVDTLHITHCFRPGILSWAEMSYVDRSLAALGGKLILLQARPEMLWERLMKSGYNPEAVHNYYANEQRMMERMARRSVMETLFLAAEDAFEENLEKAYGFWMDL